MKFTKAHGTGNDFVVLTDWDDDLDLTPSLVRALCDRRRGLGADGVLRITAADGVDAFMDYRNADGSVAEMCGNGARVVAKHVVDHGFVTPRGDALRLGTRAGTKDVSVSRHADGVVYEVTVDMGAPAFGASDIPVDAGGPEAVDVALELDDRTLRLTAVSMGNPHAVILVDDVRVAQVATTGPAVETHPRFPKHTNVEFVQIVSETEAFVRVWERGVGETAACGSGACAVLAALQRLGRAGEAATLHFPGGDLHVRREPSPDAPVLLTGAAVEVASGHLDPRWLVEVTTATDPEGIVA